MTALPLDARFGGPPQVRRVVEAVTEHIRGEHLRVGDTLPGEGWFATELGVSRAVMREAFGAMSALRLIDVANGRRPRVAAIDSSVFAVSLDHAISTAQITVAEVWEVRRTLEVRTAALAARHRTPSQLKALRRLAAGMMDDAGDVRAVTEYDIALHRTIAEAGRNALYLQIVSSFAPLMEVAVPAAWRTRTGVDQRSTMITRHEAIVDAIASRDTDAAAAAMAAHFDASIGDILAGTSAAL